MVRILLVADGQGGQIYADALRRGFDDLGCETKVFAWREYFKNYPYASVYPTDGNLLKSVYYRLQNKFTFGPAVWALNRDVVRVAAEWKPDVVFVYRGTHVWRETIENVKKKTGAKVVGYNNDDPFSGRYARYFWRHFKRAVFAYDHMFCYRLKNIQDYVEMGYPQVSLLRAYYLKDKNFPVALRASNTYSCEVIFAGHFEDDGRDEALRALWEAGVEVKLFGTEWEKSRYYDYFCVKMGGAIYPVYQDYNLALNSAKMALVFLSKLNNDSYTRRNLEIPATGRLMVSEYSADLDENLFEGGREVVYFRDAAELVERVKHYLKHPKELEKIAAAGRARLVHDKHEVTDRARQVLEVLGCSVTSA